MPQRPSCLWLPSAGVRGQHCHVWSFHLCWSWEFRSLYFMYWQSPLLCLLREFLYWYQRHMWQSWWWGGGQLVKPLLCHREALNPELQQICINWRQQIASAIPALEEADFWDSAARLVWQNLGDQGSLREPVLQNKVKGERNGTWCQHLTSINMHLTPTPRKHTYEHSCNCSWLVMALFFGGGYCFCFVFCS